MLNIVNEEDKNEMVIFVGVKPRIDTDIEFAFVKEGHDKTFQRLDPSQVEAKAILLPSGSSGNRDEDEFD